MSVSDRPSTVNASRRPPALPRNVLRFPPVRLALAFGLATIVMEFALTSFFAGDEAGRTLTGHYLPTMGIKAVVASLVLIFIGAVIERRSLDQVGLGGRGLLRHTGAGFGVGLGIMAVVGGVGLAAGWLQIERGSWAGSVPHVAVFALMLLFASAFEEILFRGVLFRITEEWLGSWIALLVSAAVFGIGHVGGGASLVTVVALSVSAGCIMAAAYMVTRTLWFPIGLHWAYNLSQGLLFDNFGNAGFESPIRTTLIGPEAWIGRATSNYGPDTALLAILTVLGVAVGLLALAIRRGRIVAPSWRRGSR